MIPWFLILFIALYRSSSIRFSFASASRITFSRSASEPAAISF